MDQNNDIMKKGSITIAVGARINPVNTLAHKGNRRNASNNRPLMVGDLR